MRTIYLLPLALLFTGSLLAQDSATTRSLDEVVVTGQYKAQSVKNSVYQVRVISKEQIQRQAASKLQDVLSSQLNIRFSQDLATGGSNITMMGLLGQNVKILIDGVPMTGRQGTSNEININSIEVNSIERIEIIEGPMSVIYGADALAGVINIITKKAKKESIGVTARLHEESIGKEYGFSEGIHNQYLGASGSFKNWYANGGIGHNRFNGWKDTAIGRELVWHKKDQVIGNALLGYRTNKFNIYYRFDGLDEVITNPANITGSQPATDQEYITDRAMNQLQASYVFNRNLSANAQTSYTHFTRQVYSTLFYPSGDVRVSTAPGAHSLNTFDAFTFRATAVYRPWKAVSFQPGVDINSERIEGDRIKAGIRKIDDYAFFITSEITPNSRINIRPGLRFVKNSVYDAPPVIPSVNAKFGLTNTIDLRLAYARGFRSPSVRELYFDFIDNNHTILGNENLKAEQSNSFTGSLSWAVLQKEKVKLTATLNGFYNDVDNLIDYALDPDNSQVTTYANIAKFKSRGGTLEGNLVYKNLNANLGFGYTGRYNQFTTVDKTLPDFEWSPEVNANLSYSFAKIGLDANLFYKYTGKLPYYQEATVNGSTKIVLVETESYHWADFTLNKKLCKLFTINAGIRNLFDITRINSGISSGGAHSSGTSRPIGNGRSFFAGLVFNWSK